MKNKQLSSNKFNIKNNNNNNNTNFKRNLSMNKKREYYYSTANVNKRKFQSNSNNIKININNNKINKNISINEEILPTPIKLKYNNINELEKYDKNNNLLNFLENEKNKFRFILNIFKNLNNNINEIIIKKKIQIYEINKKINENNKKKEKENFIFNQNLSDKIDNALIKANLILENINNLGKKNNINNNNNNNKSVFTNYNLKKNNNNNNNEISEIISNYKNKFNENLEINKENLNLYFFLITKNRKIIKESKEKLKRTKIKIDSLNINNIFNEIHTKNIENQMKIDSNNNNNNDFNYIENENKILKISSILNTNIYKNLYLKVFFDLNKNFNIEEKIYNVFSLWFLINNMKNYLNYNNNNNEENIFKEIKNFVCLNFNDKKYFDNFFDLSEKNIIKKITIDNISKFFDYLNNLSKNNNNNNKNDFNEDEIFNKDFYKIYKFLFNYLKIKTVNFIINNIENNNNNNNNFSKEELNYFKNIQSLFMNNGNYLCNISEKNN